jgi:uncharacterized protein YjaG (DUF416 family)
LITEKDLNKRFKKLDENEALAFALMVMERAKRYYEEFSLAESWGDAPLLASSLDHLWRTVEVDTTDGRYLADIRPGWELPIPDSDDFSSAQGSAAQSAALAHHRHNPVHGTTFFQLRLR